MAFITLDELSTKEPIPGCFAKFVHSDQMTLASWEIGADTLFPEHSHPHEQIMLVVEGEFELTVGGETKVVRPGIVAVIPSGVSHSGRALSDCRAVDAFHPVREDYR